jgi:ABC-type spermidine/putrescine transport system permease subunit II
MAPAVVALVLWMLAPLLMSIYFSFVNYNLMQPGERTFNGLANFEYFITDPDFWPAVWNTLVLIGSVIVITVVLGVALALLVNEPFPGRGIVRVLLISPFFVMPTVNALLWKHMMMNPIYGVLADVWRTFGAEPIDWLTDLPLFSVIVMVAWQWLPFAVLIFITSLQSLDREQMEAARMDGATAFQRFGYLTLPPRTADGGGDHDRDDLPALRVRRDRDHDRRRPRQREHEPHLPDLQAVADELRRRRGFRGRAVRGGAGQHRGGLPDPHHRQEPRLKGRTPCLTKAASPSCFERSPRGSRRCCSSSRSAGWC